MYNSLFVATGVEIVHPKHSKKEGEQNVDDPALWNIRGNRIARVLRGSIRRAVLLHLRRPGYLLVILRRRLDRGIPRLEIPGRTDRVRLAAARAEAGGGSIRITALRAKPGAHSRRLFAHLRFSLGCFCTQRLMTSKGRSPLSGCCLKIVNALNASSLFVVFIGFFGFFFL